MKICCVDGCGAAHLALGYCVKHYTRFRKYGDPNTVVQKQMHGATLAERFGANVEKTDGCWQWTGYRGQNGYGRLNIAGRPVLAHRISWELHNEPITSDQHVLHRCDNPPCVRPDHLFLGDQAANNADMRAKGRFRPGATHGSEHWAAKLTENDVREIRASSDHPQQIADRFGISRRTVRAIRAMQSWRHLT